MSAWDNYGSYEEPRRTANASGSDASTAATTTKRPKSFVEVVQAQHKASPFPSDEHQHITTLGTQAKPYIEEILGHGVGEFENYVIRKSELKMMQENVPAVIINNTAWGRVEHIMKTNDLDDTTIAFHVIVYPMKTDVLRYTNGLIFSRDLVLSNPNQPYNKYTAQFLFQLCVAPPDYADRSRNTKGYSLEQMVEITDGDNDENRNGDDDNDDMSDTGSVATLNKKPRLMYGQKEVIMQLVVIFDGLQTFKTKDQYEFRDLMAAYSSNSSTFTSEEKEQDLELHLGRIVHLKQSREPKRQKKIKRSPGQFATDSDIDMEDEEATPAQNPVKNYQRPTMVHSASTAPEPNSYDAQTMSFLDQLSKHGR